MQVLDFYPIIKFQSLIGELKTKQCSVNFITCMIVSIPYRRTKNSNWTVETDTDGKGFQSLIGELKTLILKLSQTNKDKFQSLIGELKTCIYFRKYSDRRQVSIPYRRTKNSTQLNIYHF